MLSGYWLTLFDVPTLVFRAYGRTVSVSGPSAALDLARLRLPPAYRPGAGQPERHWKLRRRDGIWQWQVDEQVRRSGTDVVAATEALLSDLELWIAEKARRYVFVHAGCVVMDGRAIVLPGRTMSGKSSLTAALVRAGATYYSDEYAVLDTQGMVRPYPRQLSLRNHHGTASARMDAADLGGRTGYGPAPVGLIAALRYDGAAGWSTEPLTRGQAVLRLIDNTVPARSRPRAVLTAIGQATEGAQIVAGTRGDATEAAERLVALLRRARSEEASRS